jgi:hypothetical protein
LTSVASAKEVAEEVVKEVAKEGFVDRQPNVDTTFESRKFIVRISA